MQKFRKITEIILLKKVGLTIMPKVTEQHQESRRLQIIDAAMICFAQNGFHKTTMQDIIAQSNVSAGSIYTYFKSKTDIINAIADIRHEKETQLLKEALKMNELKHILQYLVEHFIGSLTDDRARKERRVGVQMWAEALHNPDILATVHRGIEEPLHFLKKMITEAQAKGELSERLSPDAAARSIIALFHGFILQMAWDENVNVEEYQKVMSKTIEQLLR